MTRKIVQTSLLACGLAIGVATTTTAFAEDHKEHKKQNSALHEQKKHDKKDPATFLKGALDANRMEIQAADLAAQRAQNAQVKELARTIADHHKQAQKELEQLAQKHSATDQAGLENPHKETMTKLQAAQGREFDKAYLKHVIHDHQRDIAALKECKESFAQMPELKSIVDRNLPAMEQHLAKAKSINESAQFGIAATAEAEGESAEGAAASAEVGASDNDSTTDPARSEAPNPAQDDKEILGVPTSDNDGTILGNFPAPDRTVEAGDTRTYTSKELQDGEVDPNVDNVSEADSETVIKSGQSQQERD